MQIAVFHKYKEPMGLRDKKTEDRILDAAREVFMKHGLYGARMQDIADTAGINKALLHYYFRNKQKLFDHVFEGALIRYFEQMQVFSDESLPVLERVLQFVDKLIDFLSDYPQMSMFIIKELAVHPEAFSEKVVRIKKGKGVSLISLLQAGMAEGTIRQTDSFLFLVNLHSLCAYPFLAASMFRVIQKRNKVEWADTGNAKLKASVREFVVFKLSIQ